MTDIYNVRSTDLLRLVAISLTFLLSGCYNQTPVNACADGDMLMPDLELAVEGDGLFLLGNNLYTRKGSFCVDKSGFLLHESGHRVRIYAADNSGYIAGAIKPAEFKVTSDNGAILESISVEETGVIKEQYSSGEEMIAGQFVLAFFASPQNLLFRGDNLCAATRASGVGAVASPEAAGSILKSGALEGGYECDRGSPLFNTKLEVNGPGYFVLKKDGITRYAKSLKIGTDADGNLVDENSFRITGFPADNTWQLVTRYGEIRLPLADIPPVATRTVTPQIKLDALATTPLTTPFNAVNPVSWSYASSVVVYDSFGSSHVLTLFFVKATEEDTWNLYSQLDGQIITSGGITPLILTFNPDGEINSQSSAIMDSYTPTDGAANMTITFDFSKLSQINGSSETLSIQQDGYTSGRFIRVNFTPNGLVQETFNNEQTVTAGQVLLTYQASRFVGEQILSPPGTNGLGVIQIVHY